MKNNINLESIKFWEDMLYFSAFYADFCLCPKSVITTTFKVVICGKYKNLNKITKI